VASETSRDPGPPREEESLRGERVGTPVLLRTRNKKWSCAL
jgi:hypothetical protein